MHSIVAHGDLLKSAFSGRPPMQKKPVQYLSITADSAGQRIDNFLMTRLKGVPRTHIYRILRKGEVRVNKKRIQPSYRLQEDDEIRLPPVRLEEKPVIPTVST